MFLKFKTTEERRARGGSAFVEIQYCRLPRGTSKESIVSFDGGAFWDIASLYIDDENIFFNEYGKILGDGLYNNMKRGTVDIYGINYYSPENTESIIERLKVYKPNGYEIFLDWLAADANKNGFYVLGI